MNAKIGSFIFDQKVVNTLLRVLPDKRFIQLHYLAVKGRFPNLKNPDTYTEKIQWIKLNGGIEKYAKYVDKYEVRSYVKKVIGEKYLIPLLGVWDTFDEIPFESLPNKFVLKTTHGSSYNYICQDKSKLNKNALRKKMHKWMTEDFYLKTREAQYKNCHPRIICEEYLDEGPGGLTDFKFACKNGEPILIYVIGNRLIKMLMDAYTLDFVKLPIFSNHPKIKRTIEKPKNLREMIEISRKLAQPFPFVRVDLYSFNGNIYFGELTFTPTNGLEVFENPAADQQLGETIDLSGFKKK